jgi:hypothetical protein
VGYVSTEGLSRIDAFLNSAMLLGGMGPVNMPGNSSPPEQRWWGFLLEVGANRIGDEVEDIA